MFDFVFDVFRREKPLYRWRERPSLSAFITNAERKQKPLQFWGRILASLGIWWALAAVYAGVSLLLNYEAFQNKLVNKFLELFFPTAFALTIVNFGLTTFSSFADRIVELFDDRLRFQGSEKSLSYSDLEFFAFTQMVQPGSGARYSCVVLNDRNQETTIIGIPNPRVALRVHEVLSSRVMFRNDLVEITLEDAET